MAKNRSIAMDLVEDGVVSCKQMLRDAINWMSESECGEFLEKNGYLLEEEEDDE